MEHHGEHHDFRVLPQVRYPVWLCAIRASASLADASVIRLLGRRAARCRKELEIDKRLRSLGLGKARAHLFEEDWARGGSERALKSATAEMYVQGVTTRKVTAVMEELCGLEATSSQASRAVQALDADLRAYREQERGEIP